MSSVVEIEQAIVELSPKDFVELGQWFDEQRNRKWDRQIQEDASSGKLDSLYEMMQAENRGQPEMALNDFLHDKKLS